MLFTILKQYNRHLYNQSMNSTRILLHLHSTSILHSSSTWWIHATIFTISNQYNVNSYARCMLKMRFNMKSITIISWNDVNEFCVKLCLKSNVNTLQCFTMSSIHTLTLCESWIVRIIIFCVESNDAKSFQLTMRKISSK